MSNKAERLRLGLIVFVGLSVLTGVEYWIATALHSSVIPYLAVIGLFKAGLIVQYFMHIGQLWHGER